MANINGGCLCGKVRYKSVAEPQMTALCHCTHCQKQTGAAYSVNVVIPSDSLNMDGSPSTYEEAGDSGQPVRRIFCGGCGSPIYTKVDVMPDVVFLKGGTLDDPSWLEPTINIWCSSAQPWVPIDKNMSNFDRNPDLG